MQPLSAAPKLRSLRNAIARYASWINTQSPSASPTATPSSPPSTRPSAAPSQGPTNTPSSPPTSPPTSTPSQPTIPPTRAPTTSPTSPTAAPTTSSQFVCPPNDIHTKAFPSLTAAWCIPGSYQTPTDPTTLLTLNSTKAVIDWELKHADIAFGGY